MNRKELQNKYEFLKPTNIKEGLMAFGFECGNGWLPLLEKLFIKMNKIVKKEKLKDFRVIQVKEKYGGARIYCNCSTNEIEDLIEKTEEESYKTCELCGSKNNVTQTKGWISSLCGKCLEERNG